MNLSQRQSNFINVAVFSVLISLFQNCSQSQPAESLGLPTIFNSAKSISLTEGSSSPITVGLSAPAVRHALSSPEGLCKRSPSFFL